MTLDFHDLSTVFCGCILFKRFLIQLEETVPPVKLGQDFFSLFFVSENVKSCCKGFCRIEFEGPSKVHRIACKQIGKSPVFKVQLPKFRKNPFHFFPGTVKYNNPFSGSHRQEKGLFLPSGQAESLIWAVLRPYRTGGQGQSEPFSFPCIFSGHTARHGRYKGEYPCCFVGFITDPLEYGILFKQFPYLPVSLFTCFLFYLFLCVFASKIYS